MARVKKKTKTVNKFGGVDNLGTVKTDLHSPLQEQTYDASSVEAKSEKTHLEDDKGEGEATIIRCFTFGMNPEVFVQQRPTKQDLFNYHIRGIEMALFKDGMNLYTDVPPRLTFDVNKLQYCIFVAARPRKGYLLHERPQTLSEIAHG